ncbi:peptidase S8/S53 domain-containing protein [Mycena epipterygia]|nr:peptidase S8/S53 domain-containing protein [Mycena epipterygia]
MGFRKLPSALSLVVVASAGTMVLHERRTAPANDTITLRVALTSNNSISTPGNSDFRQLTRPPKIKIFAQPSSEAVSAFSAFASANGLTPDLAQWRQGVNYCIIKFNSIVTHHRGSCRIAARTPQINVRLVTALSTIDKRGPAASCNSSLVSGIVTPTCLQELYGIPPTPATEKNNALLVTGYKEEWAQTADLAKFLTLLRPDIPPNTTFTLLTMDNGTNEQGPSEAGVEPNLDIQYTRGVATGVPIQFLSVGRFDFLNFPTDLLDTITFLDGVLNPPTVMKTYYVDLESNFGASLATSHCHVDPLCRGKICNGYMALGARGIFVVFASGDDPRKASDRKKAINFTGGGFSNVFPAPYYQTAAIAGFLQTVPADFDGTFNKTGRDYPDVSTQGWNFQMVADNQVILEGGTSASSPTFASIIALINDRLLAAGKPVLGFLNPFLYPKAPTAFTDITTGHNSGFKCPASSAVIGWDPLSTWFRNPIFSELLAAAMA